MATKLIKGILSLTIVGTMSLTAVHASNSHCGPQGDNSSAPSTEIQSQNGSGTDNPARLRGEDQ